MAGWISMHRKIRDHWVWQEKPFSKGQAWIDILLMVNYEDKKIVLGNELIEVKRGSRITSIRQLSERWGWSNTKIKNFLGILEKDGMLTVKSDSKKTVLTVVNYNDYQTLEYDKNDRETTSERQADDTQASQKHTNNNKNNNNKENKDNNIIMTSDEAEYISVLENIKNYPLDREKDLEYYKTLEKRYPTLDLVEAIKKFEVWVLDNPFKEKANHRSQINTSFSKYVEWKTCIKEVKEERPKRGPLKLIIRDGA